LQWIVPNRRRALIIGCWAIYKEIKGNDNIKKLPESIKDDVDRIEKFFDKNLGFEVETIIDKDFNDEKKL
jgi:hypothetical protein